MASIAHARSHPCAACTLAQGPGDKFSALTQWVVEREATGRARTANPRLWLDRICLHVGALKLHQTLPLMPIFIAGSRHMVVLAGTSYSSRLWCAMEVFMCMQIGGTKGGSKGQLVILPLRGVDPDPARLFANFDVHRARCASALDMHSLKAIIEASFGDLSVFNKCIQSLRHLDHDLDNGIQGP